MQSFGLVLLAWTASFTYFAMTLHREDDRRWLRRLRDSSDSRFEGRRAPKNEPID